MPNKNDVESKQVIALTRREIDYLYKLATKLSVAVAKQLKLEPEPKKPKKTAEKSEKAEGPDEDRAKHIAVVTRTLIDELSKNAEAMENLRKLVASPDMALTGRMATSDLLTQYDGALHVAQAVSVHAIETEDDFGTAVDDYKVAEGTKGSGHMYDTEIISSTFYGYACCDVPLLVSNLEGGKREDWRSANHALAAELLRRLTHIIPTVSPGAKKGSTAPFTYASFFMVEWGSAQPRSLVSAFDQPIISNNGMTQPSFERIGAHVRSLDSIYGKRDAQRAFFALSGPDTLADQLGAIKLDLDGLGEFIAKKVQE